MECFPTLFRGSLLWHIVLDIRKDNAFGNNQQRFYSDSHKKVPLLKDKDPYNKLNAMLFKGERNRNCSILNF